MSSRSVVGNRLREAREKQGLSQKALGIRAGFDEFTASPRIAQYEMGTHEPKFSTVERLAQVLEVPTAFLYTRDEALAELLLAWGQLGEGPKRKALAALRQLVKARG